MNEFCLLPYKQISVILSFQNLFKSSRLVPVSNPNTISLPSSPLAYHSLKTIYCYLDCQGTK